ncbi:hypothetical protein FEP95_05441 [Burkholderia multivorans]|nr:hypothetical protein [Burkholderia multivorans]
MCSEIARRLRERVADFQLTVGALRARTLPFVAELRRHRRERFVPCGEPLRIARGEFGLQMRVRVAHRGERRRRMALERRCRVAQCARMLAGQRFADLLLTRQGIAPRIRETAFGRFEARRDAVEQVRRALRERVGELAERRVEPLCDRIAGTALRVERAMPRGRHVCGRGLETVRQAVELTLHRARHRVAQRRHFLREPCHRRGDDRLQRGTGHARAFGRAFLQRCVDARRETRIRLLGAVEERLLAFELTLVQRHAARLERRHHRLQPVDERGHRVGLLLQQAERFVAPMRGRMHAQRRRDLRVELLRGLAAFAAHQRRQQPEHRGRRDAGDRRAEREPEPLHGRNERGADRIEIGRAFERGTRALQRDDHPEQRAEHAEQHEQTDEIGRQCRARQRDARAVDARTHRAAQAGRQRVEPRIEPRRRFGERRDRARQRCGRLPVAQQFPRARDVACADQQRDGRRERIRSDIAGGDPAHGEQTGSEDNEINTNSGHM